ncbi:aminopeptidase N [Drosophila tropicalis]|uniref:aminopeptidase N n=1 Tax=Drosophila tropicalis TaxID=46794 RepID=UPI0035AB6F0F
MATTKIHRLGILLLTLCLTSAKGSVKRSIDLSASHVLIPDIRLPTDVIPLDYELYIEPNLEEYTFTGIVKINLSWIKDARKISLHAHFDLTIDDRKIKLQKIIKNNGDNPTLFENITILRGDRLPRKTVYVLYLKETVKQGTEGLLEIPFEGGIWESAEGLFRGSYTNSATKETEEYLTTYMRPNNARRVFPCFDEPGVKVPFKVSIARPKEYTVLFNTPLEKTSEHSTLKDYVTDHFERTPAMSTFTFGFIISKLTKYKDAVINENSPSAPKIQIWSNQIDKSELKEIHARLFTVYNTIQDYLNVSVPLKKIDVVAVPGLTTVRPADNWGLLVLKESELLKKSYFSFAQELIYQWIGSWVTPYWWSDAHVNKALASFLASEIAIQIDGGMEFNGKYPMTLLYSLYYELSKRYPHSRITGMKQETVSFKTELVIRMLNFTLGKSTFHNGVRNFIADHHYKTFIGDDLWNMLTKQALSDKTLDGQYSITDIASSWITKDRLPVVNVQRNYETRSAMLQQKVYLRERPHDVPEQDKMLWWIPITLNRQDTLNFSECKPYVWINKTRQINISNLPESNQFIIINHEEIGPFPVNYDERNWNMLSNFLQTESGRTLIPTLTRAKLLHDAWNLAYAGDLSFATAFNMTLFMKFERNHIVWNPVFTFIDHIGRHIDMSAVHKKFEAYVTTLLAPLYEELGPENTPEEYWRTDLRSLAKTFLCRAGYRPCIEEAQKAYKVWQESSDPDHENPVPNQYICPVFKWGSIEEWEFGLQRVIQFPKSRVQSERTYLLKTLAGCPSQPEKINRLLDLTILQQNINFTENDIFLIFSMLTGGSSGYTTLFNFLSEHWVAIRERFANKTNLWDSLISSATGVFSTQKGYDMVKKLYEEHPGEFGSAQHIIEKSLRNIKEEAQWSDQNLPVIEKWLDNYLSQNNEKNQKFLEN